MMSSFVNFWLIFLVICIIACIGCFIYICIKFIHICIKEYPNKGKESMVHSQIEINKASEQQSNPVKGNTDVWPYVVQDIKDRVDMGKEKYGTVLQTHNGRSALWDAYQEAIDLVMYLRQAILEQEGQEEQ